VAAGPWPHGDSIVGRRCFLALLETCASRSGTWNYVQTVFVVFVRVPVALMSIAAKLDRCVSLLQVIQLFQLRVLLSSVEGTDLRWRCYTVWTMHQLAVASFQKELAGRFVLVIFVLASVQDEEEETHQANGCKTSGSHRNL